MKRIWKYLLAARFPDGTRSKRTAPLTIALLVAAAVCLVGSPREAGAVPTLALNWVEQNGESIAPTPSVNASQGDTLVLEISIIPDEFGVLGWELNMTFGAELTALALTDFSTLVTPPPAEGWWVLRQPAAIPPELGPGGTIGDFASLGVFGLPLFDEFVVAQILFQVNSYDTDSQDTGWIGVASSQSGSTTTIIHDGQPVIFDAIQGGINDDLNLILAEVNVMVAAVPEPSTLLLFGFGLAGLGFFRWRRKAA